MTTIVTRTETQTDGTAAKGSELTWSEVDTNFINLNDDKVEVSGAIVFHAKAAEALSKGDVVYVSGVSGNTPEVSKADADDASKMPAFGLAESDASLNAAVNVVTFGTIYELDTSAFSVGDNVYVSTTAGGLTATKPTGESSLIQNIGLVIRSHASAGSIKVGGAGRTNAVPNLNNGNVFIGNASNQAETRALVEADISDFGTYAALTDLSVTTNTAGTPALSYDNTTGVFSYTPPDLNALTEIDTLDSVTGRGDTTTNSISVGGLTVDTNTLVVDSTNNAVGINTVTASGPQSTFHIEQNGDDADGGFRLSRDNALASYTQYIDTSSIWNLAYGNPASDDSPTDIISVTTSGHVGIGDSAPTVPISVRNGSSEGTVAEFYGSTDGKTRALSLTSGTANSFSGAEWTYNIASSGGEHVFSNNNGELLRIKNTGLVGIGTTPSTALHVKGADPVLTIQDNAGTLAQVEWVDSSGNTLMNMRSGGTDFVTDLEAGGSYIYRNAGSEQFRINSSGNVSASKFRATSTGDASLSSTDHGFQVGDTSGGNIIIDGNEIMARNNGANSPLYLQQDGGDVRVNNVVINGTSIGEWNTTAGQFNLLSTRATTTPQVAGDSYGLNAHYMTSAATGKPAGTDHSLLTLSYSSAWQNQIAQDWRNGGRMYIRGQNNGTWSSWSQVLTTADTPTNAEDSDKQTMHDTRAALLAPNSYPDKSIYGEFTNQINGSWWSAITAKGWNDGYAAWQLIGYSSTASDNRLFFKNSHGTNNTWSGLQEVYHSGRQPTLINNTAVTGQYGSFQVDGGATGGWEGYSIGGRAVFMHNNSTTTGLYNDVNNHWLFTGTHNGSASIYHAGAVKGYTYGSGWRVTGNLLATSDVYAYYSDERLKDKTGKIENALDKVDAIETFYYTHNDIANELGYEGKEQQVGVSAQSVAAVMPEVVHLAPIDDDGEGNSVTGENYQTVNYQRLVPLLLEAIKELRTEVEALKGDR